jgi:uncharacterized protein YjaG (DUF416 family)
LLLCSNILHTIVSSPAIQNTVTAINITVTTTTTTTNNNNNNNTTTKPEKELEQEVTEDKDFWMH